MCPLDLTLGHEISKCDETVLLLSESLLHRGEGLVDASE
jgi:hypothetical protein